MEPIRLLHVLDGLLSQAAISTRGQGAAQRRQRQRIVLVQRLLDTLPGPLARANQSDVLFWRGMRWGTLGLLLAWLLNS